MRDTTEAVTFFVTRLRVCNYNGKKHGTAHVNMLVKHRNQRLTAPEVLAYHHLSVTTRAAAQSD